MKKNNKYYYVGKCKIIGCNNYINWHWQPTIDEKNPYVFIRIGFFYRSFLVINICNDCKENIKRGYKVEFKYKGKLIEFNKGKLEVKEGD